MKIAIVVSGAATGVSAQGCGEQAQCNLARAHSDGCGLSSRDQAAAILEYYLLRAIDAAQESARLCS